MHLAHECFFFAEMSPSLSTIHTNSTSVFKLCLHICGATGPALRKNSNKNYRASLIFL